MNQRCREVLVALAATMTVFSATSVAQGSDYDPLPIPVFRGNFGPTFRASPDPELSIVHFGMDATGGVTVFGGGDSKRASWVFNAEAGVYFDTADVIGFNLTTGIGYGSAMASVLYHPRLLVGSHESELAIGMRNGVMGHFVYDILSVELGHQFIHYEDTLRHDVVLMVGVNPGAAIYLFVKIITGLR